MKKNILIFASAIILASCNNSTNETNNKDMEKESTVSSVTMPDANDIMSGFSLTVAEGKRLIAKGIAAHPLVKRKMESGMIIITRGTTNTYIAEEIAGLTEEHGKFMTGNISNKPLKIEGNRVPEIVLINGKQVDMSFKDALAALKPGDIVFKGGNLLNYEKKQAAVTIGAPDGGTVGRIQPYTAEGPGHLIVPIGLEKEVYGDLLDYEKVMASSIKRNGSVPRIIAHKNAEIFTEIEAIKLFGNVNVVLFASGGIAGSEGGKSFAIYGAQAEVDKVMKVISEVHGEDPFIKD